MKSFNNTLITVAPLDVTSVVSFDGDWMILELSEC